MIHICQGHEKSISAEVLIKTLMLLSKKDLKLIKIYINKKLLVENLKILGLSYKTHENFLTINNRNVATHWISEESNKPLSTISLEHCLKNINKDDVLFTLPTTKDQLLIDNEICKGYTEYFRRFYNNNSISMIFSSKTENIALLTDHIPLRKVPSTITNDLVLSKVETIIKNCRKPLFFEKIIFSGINPHCGENGLLGNEDTVINECIPKLQKRYKNITFSGPFPSDTIFNHLNNKTLTIFAYHDQGLSYFKNKYGFLGSNISLGLPYIRVSPDHGTAFELYGKNRANYLGCYFSMQQALNFLRKK